MDRLMKVLVDHGVIFYPGFSGIMFMIPKKSIYKILSIDYSMLKKGISFYIHNSVFFKDFNKFIIEECKKLLTTEMFSYQTNYRRITGEIIDIDHLFEHLLLTFLEPLESKEAQLIIHSKIPEKVKVSKLEMRLSEIVYSLDSIKIKVNKKMLQINEKSAELHKLIEFIIKHTKISPKVSIDIIQKRKNNAKFISNAIIAERHLLVLVQLLSKQQKTVYENYYDFQCFISNFQTYESVTDILLNYISTNIEIAKTDIAEIQEHRRTQIQQSLNIIR